MAGMKALVVDDREENRLAAAEAAKSYLEPLGIGVEYGTTFSEGIGLLDGNEYVFAVLDMELPRESGGQPEKLGWGLAKAAARRITPWVILTTGIDHHRCESAFTKYWDELVMDKSEKEKLHEMTETPKASPGAWESVYRRLMKSRESSVFKALKKVTDVLGGPAHFYKYMDPDERAI